MTKSSASTAPDWLSVSDLSFDNFEDIICSLNDISTLKQAVAFLAGKLKSKEEEIERLQQEKEAAIESKVELMVEVKQCRAEMAEMARNYTQAEKGSNGKIIKVKDCEETTTEEALNQLRSDNEEALNQLRSDMIEKFEQQQKSFEEVKDKIFTLQKVHENVPRQDVELLAKKDQIKIELGTKELHHQTSSEDDDKTLVFTEKNIVQVDPCWKNSGTMVTMGNGTREWKVDTLNWAAFKSGEVEWGIRIKERHSVMLLGVVSASKNVPKNYWLGKCSKSWGVHNAGMAFHNEKEVNGRCRKYSSGSIVYFSLDLRGEGILRVGVDNSPLLQIFSRMKSYLGKDDGFLPAVSLYDADKVELIGYQWR